MTATQQLIDTARAAFDRSHNALFDMTTDTVGPTARLTALHNAPLELEAAAKALGDILAGLSFVQDKSAQGATK